jgi:tRNA 2-thiocytidine biosynthesis protein TtcA
MVIRPLAYCREKDLQKFAELKDFPIIPCNLCGSQDNLQRQVIKSMMQEWDKRFPGRLETMFSALQRISPSHLLDPEQFDFDRLATQHDALQGDDTAFDPNQMSARLLKLGSS